MLFKERTNFFENKLEIYNTVNNPILNKSMTNFNDINKPFNILNEKQNKVRQVNQDFESITITHNQVCNEATIKRDILDWKVRGMAFAPCLSLGRCYKYNITAER